MPIAPRLRTFLVARLSPEDAFGLHLSAGVAVLLLAAWLFGSIAADVVAHAEITVLDTWLAAWFHQYARSGWTPVMLFITHLHNTAGVLVMAGLLAVYLYRQQAYYWFLSVLLAVPGGMLLNVMLKYTFQRARPSFEEPLLTLATYSFPSGHTAGATFLYGMLAAYLVCRWRSWPARVAAGVLAVCMVALVGLSRIYLGAHYLSDVLAGMVEGCGWVAICIAAVSSLRRRRALRGARVNQSGETP